MNPSVTDKLRRLLPLLAALLCVMAVSLHFCLWKSGMFIDEIYTYGLANSHEMPFLGGRIDDTMGEQLLTREDLFDYVAVTGQEDSFDLVSVYTNQVKDVHPPLHYWIINLVSSLVPGQFSKWIGLIPDLIIYLSSLVLLWLLCVELFENRWIAVSVLLLYGMSHVGLSTMLMIRMYVLLTFFTVLLALLAAKELREPKLTREIAIGVCIFLGLLTQYYFVFYAFFLCAFIVLRGFARKEWKSSLRFALCAFAGVGLMLVCFPAAITQLTADRLVSGTNAMENLENLGAWPARLRYYFGQIRRGIPAACLVGALAMLAAVPAQFFKKREFRTFFQGSGRCIFLILPAILTVFVAAVIAPVVEGRYIYNVMPVFTLAAGLCLFLLVKNISKQSLPWFSLAVLALAFGIALRDVPEYIYDEHRDYNTIVAEHADAPCVYFTGYYAPVTQDLIQLLAFDDVFVTEDPASPALAEYLRERDSEEIMVYVDVSGFWGSGFDAQEMIARLLDEADYTDAEPAYDYGLSSTWLLSR